MPLFLYIMASLGPLAGCISWIGFISENAVAAAWGGLSYGIVFGAFFLALGRIVQVLESLLAEFVSLRERAEQMRSGQAVNSAPGHPPARTP